MRWINIRHVFSVQWTTQCSHISQTSTSINEILINKISRKNLNPICITFLKTLWFSFWRSKDRFSLDQLRYLAGQLTKVHIVNEVNKDFVIEALRSIAELITYGDQHDPSFFEFFMENQVVGDFVRVLKLSRTISIPLQLLQTVSISPFHINISS
ncbi:protein TRANSPARENT TESTA 9 [Lathyrus oleraceus]|uniref:protein TRANSPARENT TESTA 9 n=1 Tax=Pisum sativum TaxID=3888 RepID=UPI0021D23BCA|nr:protein TRANSPARENT TESTA 9-like [Pisum sativum]